MTLSKISGVAAVLLMTASLPMHAQSPAPASRRDTDKDGKVSQEERRQARSSAAARFKAADTNGDGGLSREELQKSKSFPVVLKNFDAMDANKDGKVTIEERREWAKAKRKK